VDFLKAQMQRDKGRMEAGFPPGTNPLKGGQSWSATGSPPGIGDPDPAGTHPDHDGAQAPGIKLCGARGRNCGACAIA